LARHPGPTWAIDNSNSGSGSNPNQTAAGGCQILALALSVRLIKIKNARRLQINMMHGQRPRGEPLKTVIPKTPELRLEDQKYLPTFQPEN